MVLLAVIVAGIVVLTPVADRIRVPQPIVLLLFGLLIAVVPGIPDPALDAELVLPVVLPPLLFAATQRATAGQFREAAGPVTLLAVGLTTATAAVAAVVAHLAGLPWAAAAVLGAIVSPPDPVAATAVARRLRLPERIVTVLEGEGMFNDATALVLYRVTIAAAVTGEFSAVDAAVELLLAVVVGVLVGLVAGWVAVKVLAVLHDAEPETTVTIAAPFVAYLGAEHLEGSGVLAVLVLGLYLRGYVHPSLTARGWLLGRSVWEYADFLITGAVFVMVGLELATVIGHTSTDAASLRTAAVVLAAVVLFRPLWLVPAAALARAGARRRELPVPYGWRETAVVSWAGMRGVVTVATALALPSAAEDGTALAWREEVVFVALVCVLATLLVQGLTLTPLVKRLRVASDDEGPAEVVRLRREAMTAALHRLREEAGDQPDAVTNAVLLQYEGRLHALKVLRESTRGGTDVAEQEVLEERLYALVQRGNAVEREVVLAARAAGTVSPASADEVLDDIEARAARTGP